MNYHLSTLPNGLRIITVPMKDRHSAGVAIWIRAGARYETAKLSGVSHFLEHMLFKGTKKRSTRQIKEEIEGVGGMLNAFTGEEGTCYFSKLLVEHYPKALDVLSDMVNHATLTQEEMTKERTVIVEEIKMYRDLPAHHVHDLMGEMLWPNQPLGRPIAGTPETVTALTRTEMVNYKKALYHPKNIIVTVSGSVDPEDVKARVESYFDIKTVQKESHFDKAVVRQSKPRTLFLDKKTEQTHLVVGMHGISRFSPDRYKLGMLNVILGANMSSRLFEEVREKRGLAYEIRSGLSYYHDTGSFSVSAGVETSKAPMTIKVILRELGKISKSLVTEDELRRAKDYFMSQLYMAMEDTLDHLLWVGERVLDRGELPDKKKIREGIEAVTRQDILEMAKRIFVTSHLNLALIGPVQSKVQNQIKKEFEL
jgi:predicted Zn-dependent peptidase